jgi:GAF domain-containing protein
MTDRQPIDPPAAFAELGRIRLGETDVDGVLRTIAELALRTIPGTGAVSVTLFRGRKPYTATYTDEPALELDEVQYEQDSGPCLDASRTGDSLSVPDTRTEARWPRWAARAVAAGIHSSLAIGLPVHEEVTGALNVYAAKPDTFDQDAVDLAQTFAGYAAVTLANVHLYDVTATLAQQMAAAREHRAVIEQAKGIIMGARRCTADEAFRILSKLSQDTNRKLRDVAATLVRNAEQPP